MGGHGMTRVDLQDNGIPGDRSWALQDNDRGGFKVGKRFGSVMALSATLAHEPQSNELSPPVIITLPDDRQINSNTVDVDDILSATIGTRVSLRPLAPKDQLEYYRRKRVASKTDAEAYLREVFARTTDEPLPDLRGFPRELVEFESPPGTYFDAFPLLVMTKQSLASMAAHQPGSLFDVRRFRPNIIVDADDQDSHNTAFPEQDWIGQRAKIGSAQIEFMMACPRCVMTTHGFAELPKDSKIMRSLVQANAGNLGVYATVITPGTIAIGDRLQFV